MRILVTGGAGYIGGTVVRTLLRQGHDVTVFDNFCHSRRSALPQGITLIEGDLADRARVRAALNDGRYEGVMHFAALIEAGESMKAPAVYFQNNTAATLNLLDAMVATGTKRLVFSSTAACYGEPRRTPIEEDDALDPTNVYGESKLLVERMLRWFHSQARLRYASLRYFNVAGAIDGYGEAHEPESHLIPNILDAAMGLRDTIRIFGDDYPTKDGTCVRDYIHVQDLADAHLLALGSLERQSRAIYNIGNGQGFTVREVIDSVERVTGRKVPVVVEPRRAGDPAVLVASSEKIQRELGWKPNLPELDRIIGTAWVWHQQLRGRS